MEFEVYYGNDSQWYWRLRHLSNGEVMADGCQGYSDMRDCMHGLQEVKRLAPTAPVKMLKAEDFNNKH